VKKRYIHSKVNNDFDKNCEFLPAAENSAPETKTENPSGIRGTCGNSSYSISSQTDQGVLPPVEHSAPETKPEFGIRGNVNIDMGNSDQMSCAPESLKSTKDGDANRDRILLNDVDKINSSEKGDKRYDQNMDSSYVYLPNKRLIKVQLLKDKMTTVMIVIQKIQRSAIVHRQLRLNVT